MPIDKTRRMGHILRADGRTLIVAMDHLEFYGPMKGMEQPGKVIAQVVSGGADAVMTTFGLAKASVAELQGTGLILRVDGGTTALAKVQGTRSALYVVEDALRLGADAMACMGFAGCADEAETLPYLAALAAQCYEWRMPLLAEMLPMGFENPKEHWSVENIRQVVRIGAEIGADIIKTQYTGSIESFKMVTESCFVPVVVLGGSKMETDEQVLRVARDAIDAGAAGVAMGRNIWQHAHPDRMTRAVGAVIHENASVQAAMEFLKHSL